MPGVLDSFLGNVMSPVSAAFDVGAARAAQSGGGGGGGGGDDANLIGYLSQMAEGIGRRNDQEYQMRKQQIDQQYKVALMNARTAQDVARANAEYQRAQVELAKGRLQLDTDIAREDAAYKRLNLMAQLRGPRNAFKYAALTGQGGGVLSADYLRGLAGQMTPTGQQQALGSYAGPMGGQAEPMTAAGLAQDILGGGTGAQAQASEAAQWIKQFGANPGGARAGAWEQLGPYRQQLVAGGLEEAGYDPEEVLGRYQQASFFNR